MCLVVPRSYVVGPQLLSVRMIANWVKHLGARLGFESKLVSYCLRRGAACVQNMKCRISNVDGHRIRWIHKTFESAAIRYPIAWVGCQSIRDKLGFSAEKLKDWTLYTLFP